MARTPTDDQFNTAIAWLQANEADTNDGYDEKAACEAVAAWLDEYRFNQMLREKARELGVPVSAVRKRIKEMEKAKG